MASLTGQQINNTYQSLLKTTDNGELGQQTPSVITDGAGNATPLSLAQYKVILEKDNQRLEVNDVATQIQGDTVVVKDATSTNLLWTTAASIALGNSTNYLEFDATNAAFTGAVDFAGATVTGLPGGGGAPAISFVPSTPVSFTGPSSNDTIIASALIPANTFASGDVLEFTLSTPFDFSAGGWIYSSVWIYTDNTTIYGGDSIGQIQAPTGRDGLYKKILYINDANTQYRSYSLACDTSQQVYSGDPWYSYAINWTVDQYINVHAWVDNAGTTISVPGFTMKKIN